MASFNITKTRNKSQTKCLVFQGKYSVLTVFMKSMAFYGTPSRILMPQITQKNRSGEREYFLERESTSRPCTTERTTGYDRAPPFLIPLIQPIKTQQQIKEDSQTKIKPGLISNQSIDVFNTKKHTMIWKIEFLLPLEKFIRFRKRRYICNFSSYIEQRHLSYFLQIRVLDLIQPPTRCHFFSNTYYY